MRVAILCGPSPRAAYVANRLCARLDVRCIMVEAGRDLAWTSVRRALRPATLRAKLYRRVQPLLFPPDAHPRRTFFADGRPRWTRPDLLHRVAHVNARCVSARLDRRRIDLVAVFGTSLIRNATLLARYRGRILNLHGGLSPWYRGSDCTFWALYNNEPERVGCTIHHIDHGIDSGELIAQVCPAVSPGQREYTLFYAALKLAADVYAEAIERLARGETLGVPQPARGRLYRFHDRMYRHDRRLHQMYAAGTLRRVQLPPRVRWFPPAAREAIGAATRAPRLADQSVEASAAALA